MSAMPDLTDFLMSLPLVRVWAGYTLNLTLPPDACSTFFIHGLMP